MICRWISDDVCCYWECPACGDFCPCANYPEICKYAEEVEDEEECEPVKHKKTAKYKEVDTECDNCEYSNTCYGLIEITSIFDTRRRHFTKGIDTVCKKEANDER